MDLENRESATMSEALEIGKKLVESCRKGDFMSPYHSLYSDRIVSVEGADMPNMPATLEGKKAVLGKAEWWDQNHTVNSAEVTGPFVGLRPDQFVVKFDMDITAKDTGQRNQMSEVALYTVKDGKVVREEFLYLMG
jgi:hypothetical protein